jgi:hypothetical protein
VSSAVAGFDLYENMMVFKVFWHGCDGLWIWGFFSYMICELCGGHGYGFSGVGVLRC